MKQGAGDSCGIGWKSMSESKERDPETEEDSLEALQRKLEEEKRRNEELLSRLKYAQADLENYRKRMDKELKEAGEALARTLVSRLLVVQDELDLAVKHARGGSGGAEMMEGLSMVQRNLLSALQAVGVEKIAALGERFDPAVHEAVSKVQGTIPGADSVVEEVRSGFMFRGQLLRPSLVKVELASKTAKEEAKMNE
jgi:molecular chaperone GrpE